MPSSSVSLTISSAGRCCERLVEVGLEAVALAVDDAALAAAPTAAAPPARRRASAVGGGVDALEQLQERCSGS